ncbi:hypothetical protein PIN31009_00778 [Pandoraea iniqua]|uniref:Uncharacterized protein n=1 Tax=Pandoraea iniqua TaxID=2508288 RepID=A0A5E4SFW2_9BURK|nr:hypothetical protein [Pandoraea iniqua]VVD74195.1 hypothetical protein PIN31009_00778 [Pandoraea iniqua]VVD77791.1 hypothetical protein PIN31115_00953 [Pandoraea iniqua]
MQSSTIRMLRAYLLVASLGATCIDACVVIAMLVFDVPQTIFGTTDFRLSMAGSLVLLILAARSLAGVAFQAALNSRHATQDDGQGGNARVAVRDDCPHRLLVLFHISIHRQRLSMDAA